MNTYSQLPPPTIDWNTSNLAKSMDRFIRQVHLYFDGPMKDVDSDTKLNYLLIWSGIEGQEISDTFPFRQGEERTLDKYIQFFKEYANPRSNFRVARHNLLKCKQNADESAHAFLSRLRQTAKQCEYGRTVEETIVLDLFIFGIYLQSAQKSLIREGSDLTIEKALGIVETEEATCKQMEALRTTAVEDSSTLAVRARQPSGPTTCGNCGTKHHQYKCPAKGKYCLKCNKKGHFAKVCHSKMGDEGHTRRQSFQPQRKYNKNKIHMAAAHMGSNDDSSTEELYFHTVKELPLATTEAFTKLKIGNSKAQIEVDAKIDTGAMSNLLPKQVFKELKGVPLEKSAIRLIAFGGSTIDQEGTCRLGVRSRDKFVKATFHVVKSRDPILIGLQTSRELGLVTLNLAIKTDTTHVTDKASRPTPPHDMKPVPVQEPCTMGNLGERRKIIEEFPDVFDSIGCLPGEHTIHLNPEVPPVVHPPRRVPISLKGKLKLELDSLEAQGIISPVKDPTPWVNSFVCTTKRNGSVRLCLDPRDLNKAVHRPHYATPTFEDITAELDNARWFTKVDIKSGYWHLKLDEKSRRLTTFITPHGRYMYNRYPMGVKSAQDEFQRAMQENFGDLENVLSICDDIVVYGFEEDGSDHDKALRQLMFRARERNCRFNSEKFVVKTSEIPFYGHIISRDGVKPDPRKIEAITQMQPPEDAKQLTSFLGLVNYLNKFSPRLATLTKPLRELTSKKNDFTWSSQEQQAFEEIKKEIGNHTTLRYFDPKEPIVLQVDASSMGIGAALLQNDRPVAFASKALSGPETRYSNIEREMLAIVFGLEKFHSYVWGHKTTIHTDHKPLESIALKNLAQAPPRLARMLLKVEGYDFTVKYTPGKTVPIADCLSRVAPRPSGHIEGIDLNVHSMISYLNFAPTRVEDIRVETSQDPLLKQLVSMVLTGWPSNRADCPGILLPFWNFRDEIGVQDGILLKSQRIIIPASLQRGILEELHASHQGVERTRLRARSAVYWIGLNKDIEDIVRECHTCQKYQASIPPESILQHETPTYPWQYVSTDLFTLAGKEYLLVADQYSRNPFVRRLPSASSISVIRSIKTIFEEQGVPEILYSDNGPQFTSKDFKDFARTYSFQHRTSSPHYPKSNGFAERMVGTCKKILTKAGETGQDSYLAMMAYRATPLSSDIKSPAELLNGRKIRTPLVSKQQLGDEQTRTAIQKQKDHSKVCYDRKHNRHHSHLHAGQNVYVQQEKAKIWEPGKIQRSSVTPRSYIVESENGNTYRRNRQFLRPAGRRSTTANRSDQPRPSDSPPDPTQKEGPPLNKSNSRPPNNTPAARLTPELRNSPPN